MRKMLCGFGTCLGIVNEKGVMREYVWRLWGNVLGDWGD